MHGKTVGSKVGILMKIADSVFKFCALPFVSLTTYKVVIDFQRRNVRGFSFSFNGGPEAFAVSYLVTLC